ncbi:MAG: protein phosphatase 2C domain-containing protein [Anaerolineaceae bacterium]|nr:protein phosphatase 2C domain-containing protein [Anaerolineaceae bacterium]
MFSRKNKKNSSKPKPESFEPDMPVNLQAALAQSVGKARDHMEDAASSIILQQGFRDQTRRIGLFVVADGMGGHLNGELASSIAIETLNAYLIPKICEHLADLPAAEEIELLLEKAFELAQQAVLEQVNGGGSTLTAALVVERTLYYAHVGDSRLYLVGYDAAVEILTRDHSLVQRLVDLGQISQADAELHPQKNVLYRALGQTEGFKVDHGYRELLSPGFLMLCSDGLWGVVEENKIINVINSGKPLNERANQLCELANQAGGPDNISVILVEIS